MFEEIDEDNILRTAQYSIEKICYYQRQGNYGRAFAHFIVYLELCPKQRHLIEDTFINIAQLWINELESRHELENVRYCYTQAFQYFPNNIELLNHAGAFSARSNNIKQAITYFKHAYDRQPSHLPSEKNLHSMYAIKVPQWHFRMLNDKSRNQGYMKAIHGIINEMLMQKQQVNIIDIGTGTGLLSLIAGMHLQSISHDQPFKIMAIEECDLMAQIAKSAFNANNVNVDIRQTLSTNIKNEPTSNLLITEIFDCCLFGEGVLSTLIHAHKHLLSSPKTIIPNSGRLFIFGIESEELYRKYNVSQEAPSLTLPDCIKTSKKEPYDAINLKSYSYKPLTDVVQFVNIDFNNLKQLEDILGNAESIKEVRIQVKCAGFLHAFVICFDLTLNETMNHVITTNPLQSNMSNYCSCWEQGVFIQPHKLAVNEGMNLHVKVSATNDQLEINLNHPNSYENKPHECCEVTQDIISLLNLTSLQKMYENIIDTFSSIPSMILELSPIPIFSLTVLKKNPTINIQVISNTSPENVSFVEKWCKLNNFNSNHITFMTNDEILNEIENGVKFDTIIYEPMQENGLLNEEFYRNANIYRNGLSDQGVFIPEIVNLCFQVVESDYFETCTTVFDDNLLGYSTANDINKYSIKEMRSICGRYESRNLSKVARLPLHIDEYQLETLNIDQTSDGRRSGIFYWFESYFKGECCTSLDTSYHQAAFICDTIRNEIAGNQFQIEVKQHRGLLKIHIC